MLSTVLVLNDGGAVAAEDLASEPGLGDGADPVGLGLGGVVVRGPDLQEPESGEETAEERADDHADD